MVGWLPGDADHPPRPDVPVLRHLTFTEIHAFELGVYLGFLIGWAISLNESGMALVFAFAVARRIMSGKRARENTTDCEHTVGFHDVIAEPAYFGASAVAIALAFHAVQMLV